ncbi:ABC transporter, ATP-binding protein [Geomicrobium sp. JCM 19037]|uniref:ABC transporter ATP-binding protein n=1 Tax=Geomicrobium sp. JCM 19037 TaxID=1460634 RepID=UPI00045F1E59|nr:ABC transporter ATP-binding protein [Geomicrobium sp. JCM 19037]GAK05551.1 ABC transporter, ATP-binding protein [Geomicrobium sp. JCM 19037]
MVLLDVNGVSKIYSPRFYALNNLSISFEEGSFTAIMGSSGSGKSTLLHLLAGLDKPTSGTITLKGNEITNFNDNQLTRLRNEEFGFVFQQFHLLPVLTALENVIIPTSFTKHRPSSKEVTARAQTLLERLHIGHLAHVLPKKLSGGQQQRVAIARAMINKPSIVVADEPTGSLDSFTSSIVMKEFKDLHQFLGYTMIIVTHDLRLPLLLIE